MGFYEAGILEDQERQRQKELEAIKKAKELQKLADEGKLQGPKSRQEILSDLGLDIAQSPEAKAYRESIAEDEAKKFSNDLVFNSKLKQFGDWQKENLTDRPENNWTTTDLMGKPPDTPLGSRTNTGGLGILSSLGNYSKYALPINPKAPREVAAEYGYPASATPQAKEAMSNIEQWEKNELTSKDKGSAKVYAIQRRKIAEEDPNQAVIAQKRLDGLKNNTGVDSYLIDLWQGMIDSGDPIGAVEAMEKKYGATQEALRNKEEAIPLNEENAARTAAASEMGRSGAEVRTAPLPTGKLPSKEREDLIKMQQYHSDITDAISQFKNNFAVPYAGQLIKNVVKSKTDPRFGEFVTSLSSYANQYRNSIFGAALTEGEKQSFEDFISTAMNSTPEVFLRKANKVESIIRRNYGRKVKAYADYSMPDTLKSLPDNVSSDTTGGLSPDKKKRLEELRAKKAAGTLR